MFEAQETGSLQEVVLKLRRQADEFEAIGTDVMKRLAMEIRKNAYDLEKQKDRVQQRLAIETETKSRFEMMLECGERFAAELKYRVHLMYELKKMGEMGRIASNMGMPVETLEFYTVKAIEDHYQQALEEERIRDKRMFRVNLVKVKDQNGEGWNALNRTKMFETKKGLSVRKMGMAGWTIAGISKVSDYSVRQVIYILKQAPETEKEQRQITLAGKIEAQRIEALRLAGMGVAKREISKRTGLGLKMVRQLLKG